MANWIDVLPLDELKPGMHTLLELQKLELLLVNIAGGFYAIENRCSHDGGELSDGEICGTEITCPRHGARFDLKTGAVLSAPAFADIASYPVRVVANKVQVFI
ncbi:MAG: non-heme iron oxygenase ferredoxin subunit [Photobacterium frigidiphilum]|uniref:non-heme iron oxygenase ferredoxin subunit n=1 Tax=Photobacterium frigidiphilum TaxID=264736 RepID=UPI0030030303